MLSLILNPSTLYSLFVPTSFVLNSAFANEISTVSLFTPAQLKFNPVISTNPLYTLFGVILIQLTSIVATVTTPLFLVISFADNL